MYKTREENFREALRLTLVLYLFVLLMIIGIVPLFFNHA